MAAVLLLLLSQTVAAEEPNLTPSSTASAITINGLVDCPLNTVTLNSTVGDLSAYAVQNTTYLLEPGTYNITSSIPSYTAEGLCYVALGQGVTVRVLVNDAAFFVYQGAKFGLKGFKLQGAATSSGGCWSEGVLAVEDMVLQSFRFYALVNKGQGTVRNSSVVDYSGGGQEPMQCFNNDGSAHLLLEEVSTQTCTKPA